MSHNKIDVQDSRVRLAQESKTRLKEIFLHCVKPWDERRYGATLTVS